MIKKDFILFSGQFIPFRQHPGLEEFHISVFIPWDFPVLFAFEGDGFFIGNRRSVHDRSCLVYVDTQLTKVHTITHIQLHFYPFTIKSTSLQLLLADKNTEPYTDSLCVFPVRSVDPDPDPEGQDDPQKRKKLTNFMF